MDYVTKDEKTEEKLVSGLNCQPDTAKEEMQATKELWGKTGGRTYKHFVQSFAPDEKIDPEQAHRIACQTAGDRPEWKGFVSESDKVMKQNAELKQLNEQLREEAEAMISSVKEEFARKESELARKQAAADQAKRDTEATRSRQNEIIKKKAAQEIQYPESRLRARIQG